MEYDKNLALLRFNLHKPALQIRPFSSISLSHHDLQISNALPILPQAQADHRFCSFFSITNKKPYGITSTFIEQGSHICYNKLELLYNVQPAQSAAKGNAFGLFF